MIITKGYYRGYICIIFISYFKEEVIMLAENSGFETRLVTVMQDMACEWDSFNSIPVTTSLFESITQYLKSLKDEDKENHTLTLRNDFKDKDSAIIFSASLLKSEGKDGNAYALQFSFDPNDIPKDSKITDIADEESFEYINNAMNTNKHNAFNFNVQSGGAYNMFSVIRGIVITLKEFGRDALVNSSDDHNIEFKGYFILTASVSDDGKVTLKFTPSELLKQIIKEDSGIEDKDKKVDEKPVAFVA